MNLLVVGSGKGSWAIRGVQLGAALGARVVGAPSDDDCRWADVVVLVKKAGIAWAPLVHRFRKPIVWDALDFWPQPADNSVTEARARAFLQAQIAVIKPALTIGATEAMAKAADGAFLPHHTWQDLTPSPCRDVITTVGYEGNEAYLGRWLKAVGAECVRRGWKFVINPPDLRACDLLVAFRDGTWDGWICREWKSGVKVVNAIAAGRPIITQACAAVRELQPPGSVIESPDLLPQAFDEWDHQIWRASAVDQATAQAPAYRLEAVAGRYRQLLHAVARPTCAV